MIHLLLGSDTREKDSRIQKLISSALPAQARDFNLDTLYGEEVRLHTLQERLKCLPVNSPLRILIIRSAHKLRKEVKDYLSDYCRKPFTQSMLILEAEPTQARDPFISALAQSARVWGAQSRERRDTFMLCRYIDNRRAADALKLLAVLLQAGERPERILGGMRYAWQRSIGGLGDTAQRMRRLLECDREIKTGRLKPHRALEKLVLELSHFR